MKKDFKQFLILLIVSIFIAFTASFGYSVYQNYQREKKINEVKNLFNFGGTSEEKKEEAKEEIKTEEITKPEEVNSKESWNNLIINELQKDYVLDDTRPFYKRLYDKIRGKKIYNFKSINNENETLVVEMNDNKITEKFFNDGKEVLEKELVDRGVNLALGENVQQFVADEQGKVAKVITPSQEFEADMVIMCVGFRPNTELLKDKVDMLPNGAIEVNEYMQTSNPDIFAAGDSAVVHYNPSQTKNYIPLATNAVRQGMLVGRNLTEQNLAYRGTQGTSGLYLFGWKIGSTGVTKESAKLNGLDVEATVFEDNYRPEFMPTTEKVLMELVYEKGTQRIVGGQLMSKYDITQSANTLSLAVQNKMTVEDLAISDFFFQPHFDRPWNYLNLLAQAALENM